MPYIKKIELKGFKSFGPRTASLVLDKGFTALTGPNGSGKTNIVDAVLFGLGELSARRLRAESFAKLIFHGSPKAGVEKAKAAKVVIQFDNQDHRIPVDTSTVTISREVHRNGQSIYRLNGRRISRSRIVEMLSMAGISPTGHNIIVQGTITRIAEVSPHDRRKMIEDLVGIAQYDSEKAEAEEKLRTAEISIRTAMGRIDEVQKRVDDLERERNELRRCNFIQHEIKRFEAMKLSYGISQTNIQIEDISSSIEEAGSRVEKLRDLRDQLRTRRYEIATEWRTLSSEGVDKGGTRVLEAQIEIGEIKSKLSELTAKINAGTVSLEGFKKIEENSLERLEPVRKEISEGRKRIKQLKRLHDRLLKELTSKQLQHKAISDEAAKLRANLGDNSRRIRKAEQQLDKLYRNMVALRSSSAKNQAVAKALARRLGDLHTRKEKFASSLEELKTSFGDLKDVRSKQEKQLKTLQRTLDRKRMQKESMEKEIIEAGKIAETAREAVVEFATQRKLAERIAREEKALRSIEELGELGVIPGIHGRLRNLIKIDRGYEHAIEAAAAGWLDSIVVENLNVAFTCTETLTRLKLGRIKIIPIQESSDIKPVKAQNSRDIDGAAFRFVKSTRQYEPAILFVFGDTLITRDDKVALSISRSGNRTATLSGNVYETGGGIESGYYRAPIDFSAIIPSESAIENLNQAVSALKDHLTRRESDVTDFEDEIDRNQLESTRLTGAIHTLENEIHRIQKSIKSTKRNVRRIDKYIQNVQKRLEREKAQRDLQRAERSITQKEIQKLRNELADLRRKVDLSKIQEMEIQKEGLEEEIIKWRQNLGTTETELSTLQSKLDKVLKISADNIRVHLRKAKHQFSVVNKEIVGVLEQKETLEKRLTELEKSKDDLSRSVLTAREESNKFASQIDSIDKKLRQHEEEHDRADQLFNKLQLKLKTLQLQLEQYTNRLGESGYEKPLNVPPEQLELAESTVKLMRFELERLGAVNQLALSHYADQASRYKELSVRMNELEREKQAILEFMDEIEQKKRKVFLKAFNQVNENIGRFFSKLTGGGEAALRLEKAEEPLAGGIDMVVQFPAKPPILVSGASSGERSVAAVAFIFAIQDFLPATFYLFDEVDAHLDALHVEKLGALLSEETSNSQSLIVTLKPEMVSKARRIYGVYERKGVSHVVSTTFKGAA
ncbi:MAG: chromosome segregation protein SMC [Candidatus Bathyarchaeota archaeon]|nr:MAG: chromosome segregation protein SMC [Candidatus Bathyarchaeota archaeon]